MAGLDKSPKLLTNISLLPQEEMLEVKNKKHRFSIGIPCDKSGLESRVPLAPLSVEHLVEIGFEVRISRNSGNSANFSNLDYSEKGAQIVDNEEALQADIIIKVAPLSLNEISLLRGSQVIISSLHVYTQPREYFLELIRKKITAISFEDLMDKYGNYPIVRSMSEIAGRSSILIASEYLSNVHKGKGEMLGGVTGVSPSEIVIIGAGTAGTYAAKTALGLGANIKVFDRSVHRLNRLQNLVGFPVFTSTIQPSILVQSLKTADVVIGAIRIIAGNCPVFITEDMVKIMKNNSVIVDISIDQGGCFETSKVTDHKKPVYRKHDVVHYCVPNIPSRVARTASYALSNIIIHQLIELKNSGTLNNFLKHHPESRNGVYLFNGILTSEHIGRVIGVYSRDIDLLLAAL
ncbi:MAG TPA: alanine dehydrogenase [Bacteroidales bacterium]|jgi:alanine dehydrogenase|nr:alanine dehydrogenase [Bacteroidales bacterium]HRW21664.1 alanine dehydrogenase [Bacteroidales bacterium]HXK80877.1 alanine dehydrogenase [Bacteroidales bacterium]